MDNKQTGINACKHLDDILRAEIPILNRHIKEHKWYQHIENDLNAQIDFIDKYGWLMREMYCGNICPDRYKCELAKPYLPKI